MKIKRYIVTCKYELVVECCSKETAIEIAKDKVPFLHGSRSCSDERQSGKWDSADKITILSCVNSDN